MSTRNKYNSDISSEVVSRKAPNDLESGVIKLRVKEFRQSQLGGAIVCQSLIDMIFTLTTIFRTNLEIWWEV